MMAQDVPGIAPRDVWSGEKGMLRVGFVKLRYVKLGYVKLGLASCVSKTGHRKQHAPSGALNGRPGTPHQTVIALLRLQGPGDQRPSPAAIEQLLGGLGAAEKKEFWARLAAEAEHHGVLPTIHTLLTAAPETTLPAGARRIFAAAVSRHRQRTRAREACVDALLAAFQAAGLPVLLLKGAALAHLIYADPVSRPMLDIDLLISRADQMAALRLARELGFDFTAGPGARLGPRHHHLPVGVCRREGHEILLELHTDTMSADRWGRLNLANLSEPPQAVPRGAGPAGRALGHGDMLRHLCCHAFEPARQIRLVHLYDLWRYAARYPAAAAALQPGIGAALQAAGQVFADPGTAAQQDRIGAGMVPLSEIAAIARLPEKLASLFNPPGWWMHGFYGVPQQRSLLVCRLIRHPANVLRWLALRLLDRMRGSRGIPA